VRKPQHQANKRSKFVKKIKTAAQKKNKKKIKMMAENIAYRPDTDTDRQSSY